MKIALIVAAARNGVIGGGVHLKPEEVNKLVEERGDEVVFFDGRNAMEAEIGKFKGAVVPDVTTTHDFIEELESGTSSTAACTTSLARASKTPALSSSVTASTAVRRPIPSTTASTRTLAAARCSSAMTAPRMSRRSTAAVRTARRSQPSSRPKSVPCARNWGA